MATVRLALAQQDFAVGAMADNAARIGALAQQAKAAGAQLLATPQLALSGYSPRDWLLRDGLLDACDQAIDSLLPASDGLSLCVGRPQRQADGRRYNAVGVLRDGGLQALARKQVLRDDGVIDESRHFSAGGESSVIEVEGARIGLLVGEDLAQPQPAAAAAAAGAQLLLAVDQAPWRAGVATEREALLQARARETGCAIAWLNGIGGQDQYVHDGGSLLVNADGHIAARAPAFVDALLLAEFDPQARTLRADGWPVVADESPEAQLYAALVRALRDYIDKNHLPGALLGLSGGMDSALTLALAVDALGPERVTAMMLPTQYTSDVSLDGARQQAERLGVDYFVVPIETAFTALAGALREPFAGTKADTTEENLQARIRGVLLMAMSNKHGRLLLATGNKSEVAVGYATLYGDTCGGFAPISDIYKTEVYALARWRNAAAAGAVGVRRSGPVIPEAVIERAPSAELSPGQTDQDSLPDYDVLDAILRRYVEGGQPPARIVAEGGFDAGVVADVVRRVVGNEFKRRQAAPGPGVSARPFASGWHVPLTCAWRD
ncbi:MAG TPA: NAD+ synthase [Rhodanobacteraceae bacterium]|nr:NAD+ synthase [Rhodanobacteraceae bacterium]